MRRSRLCSIILAVFGTLLPARIPAADIAGKTVQFNGQWLWIEIEGDLQPRVGDRIDVTRAPVGVNQPVPVAHAAVNLVQGRLAVAKVSGQTESICAGCPVTISSPSPVRPAPPAKPDFPPDVTIGGNSGKPQPKVGIKQTDLITGAWTQSEGGIWTFEPLASGRYRSRLRVVGRDDAIGVATWDTDATILRIDWARPQQAQAGYGVYLLSPDCKSGKGTAGVAQGETRGSWGSFLEKGAKPEPERIERTDE